MKDQFVTYEIAKRLKELGFDEMCFAHQADWSEGGPLVQRHPYSPDNINSQMQENFVAIPLWQQAIDWLREKHDIDVCWEKAREWRVYNNMVPQYYYHGWDFRSIAITKALELIK